MPSLRPQARPPQTHDRSRRTFASHASSKEGTNDAFSDDRSRPCLRKPLPQPPARQLARRPRIAARSGRARRHMPRVGSAVRPCGDSARPRPRQSATLGMRALAVVRSLPEHSLIDRLVRGRAWIPVLGVLLAGIVAMQVEVLKLGNDVGRSVQRSTTLQAQNEVLQASVASLNDDQRIERLAAGHGDGDADPDDDRVPRRHARHRRGARDREHPQPGSDSLRRATCGPGRGRGRGLARASCAHGDDVNHIRCRDLTGERGGPSVWNGLRRLDPPRRRLRRPRRARAQPRLRAVRRVPPQRAPARRLPRRGRRRSRRRPRPSPAARPAGSRRWVSSTGGSGSCSSYSSRCWASALMRAAYLGSVRAASLKRAAATQQVTTVITPAPRGTITDSHGVELAVSESADDVVADPYLIAQSGHVQTDAQELAPLLGKPFTTVLAALTKPHTGFVYLAHLVPGAQAAAIAHLRIDGINLTPRVKRFYPRSWEASQVLGFVGAQGEGLSGLEYRYNSILGGRQRDPEGRQRRDRTADLGRRCPADRSRQDAAPDDRRRAPGLRRAGARRGGRAVLAAGGDRDRRQPAHGRDPGARQLAARQLQRPAVGASEAHGRTRRSASATSRAPRSRRSPWRARSRTDSSRPNTLVRHPADAAGLQPPDP